MNRPTLTVLLALWLVPAAAAVAAPRVVTDIAPVHSLVAMVMGERGEPLLLLPAGRSPHDYSLKPSQARELQSAELVVRIGGTLAPWLTSSVRSLAPRAVDVELLRVSGTRHLAFRRSAAFADGHHHGHSHGGDGHDDEQDIADVDPHAWLDPRNAVTWVGAIGEALSALDPDGASVYANNAAEAKLLLDALDGEMDTALSTVRDVGFLVYHDAFQYLESRYALNGLGAVARADALKPGARRRREVQRLIDGSTVACLFSEPQWATRVARGISVDTSARVASLDPLGLDAAPGPAHYPKMMRGMTNELLRCLGSR